MTRRLVLKKPGCVIGLCGASEALQQFRREWLAAAHLIALQTANRAGPLIAVGWAQVANVIAAATDYWGQMIGRGSARVQA